MPELALSVTKTGAVHEPVKRIGDTSKAAFTLHGIDQQDRPVLRINLRRAQLIPFFTSVRFVKPSFLVSV